MPGAGGDGPTDSITRWRCLALGPPQAWATASRIALCTRPRGCARCRPPWPKICAWGTCPHCDDSLHASPASAFARAPRGCALQALIATPPCKGRPARPSRALQMLQAWPWATNTRRALWHAAQPWLTPRSPWLTPRPLEDMQRVTRPNLRHRSCAHPTLCAPKALLCAGSGAAAAPQDSTLASCSCSRSSSTRLGI